MDKKRIRKEVLEKRDNLNDKEITSLSANITKTVINSNEFKEAKTIFIFVNFGSEVITKDIIFEALNNDKIVSIPYTFLNPKKMIATKMESYGELVKDRYGILSVKEDNIIEVPKKNIDLVFVPCVAYDRNGFRVGYGGGYYDKFLADIPEVKKIGLCYDLQLMDKVPRESFDINVDTIITEKEVINI